MSDELLHVVGVQKTVYGGQKYYRAIIGSLSRWWVNDRILHRKCRTWTEAYEYGYEVLARLHSENAAPRAKKLARFS